MGDELVFMRPMIARKAKKPATAEPDVPLMIRPPSALPCDYFRPGMRCLLHPWCTPEQRNAVVVLGGAHAGRCSATILDVGGDRFRTGGDVVLRCLLTPACSATYVREQIVRISSAHVVGLLAAREALEPAGEGDDDVLDASMAAEESRRIARMAVLRVGV